MARVRVCSFGVSLDGYGAGPDQGADHPLGVGGEAVHRWALATASFQRSVGAGGGATGVDDDLFDRGFHNIGAWIVGRNMFGPVRGAWPDETWRGWWGEDPPFHGPVFVLTRYPRPPLTMRGGTVFHFVTAGLQATLDQALAAAEGRDVRIGGGVAVIRQYLQVGLIDELHLAVTPVLLGRGEALLQGLDLPRLGYRVEQTVAGANASHVMIARRRLALL